jgi:hypothetical protein
VRSPSSAAAARAALRNQAERHHARVTGGASLKCGGRTAGRRPRGGNMGHGLSSQKLELTASTAVALARPSSTAAAIAAAKCRAPPFRRRCRRGRQQRRARRQGVCWGRQHYR